MKKLALAITLLSGALLSGCAHMINITPPLNTISGDGVAKVNKSVAYYISPEHRALLVTTPGGGGDKVSYRPYAESEPALIQMLTNVYANVVSLSSPDDRATIDANHIAYVFTPNITTTSKSSSAITWPPTNFTVTLDCKVVSGNGSQVWTGVVTGSGDAEFAEFKHDFSLAARRASKNAFNELQKAILAAPDLR